MNITTLGDTPASFACQPRLSVYCVPTTINLSQNGSRIFNFTISIAWFSLES